MDRQQDLTFWIWGCIVQIFCLTHLIIYFLTFQTDTMTHKMKKRNSTGESTYSFHITCYYLTKPYWKWDTHTILLDKRFLQSFGSSGWTHVGLTDEAQESDFRWVNGAPLYYNRFAGGEPNDQRTRNCIAASAVASWADGHCSSSRSFICSSTGQVLVLFFSFLFATDTRTDWISITLNRHLTTISCFSSCLFWSKRRLHLIPHWYARTCRKMKNAKPIETNLYEF